MCFEGTNGCHDHKLLFLRLWHFLYKTGTSQILTSHTLAAGESIAVQVCPDMNVGIHPKDENPCIGHPITRDHQRSSWTDNFFATNIHWNTKKPREECMKNSMNGRVTVTIADQVYKKKHSPWLTGQGILPNHDKLRHRHGFQKMSPFRSCVASLDPFYHQPLFLFEDRVPTNPTVYHHFSHWSGSLKYYILFLDEAHGNILADFCPLRLRLQHRQRTNGSSQRFKVQEKITTVTTVTRQFPALKPCVKPLSSYEWVSLPCDTQYTKFWDGKSCGNIRKSPRIFSSDRLGNVERWWV